MDLNDCAKLMLCIGVIFLSGCSQNTDSKEADNVAGLPDQALAYNPKAAKINSELGLSYLQEGDIERAKFKLLIAQHQDPNSKEVQEALGVYYDRVGNNTLAERYYVQAIGNAKENIGLQANNYGVFLCKRKQYDKAMKYFLMAIDDPKNVNTAKSYENAGFCALEIPNPQQAEQYFTAALRVDNKLALSSLEMAKIRFDKNQYLESQHYLDRFSAVSKPTADSLWLGIRLGRELGNKDVVSSDALLLQHQFPRSKEYAEYKKSLATAAAINATGDE